MLSALRSADEQSMDVTARRWAEAFSICVGIDDDDDDNDSNGYDDDKTGSDKSISVILLLDWW